MATKKEPPSPKDIANQIAEKFDADVLVCNAPIERPLDQLIINLCNNRKRRTNVILLLVTNGGNADPAYRIANCLQEKYDKFTIFISGYCKSAGTLIALGANEIIMSDHGELGPLDIQVFKPDELWEQRSGLTVAVALKTLEDMAFKMLESSLLKIWARSERQITFKRRLT